MRPAAIARMRGAVADGRVVAFDAKVAAPSVTRQASRRMAGFAPPGPDRGHLEGMADQPYRFANARVEGFLAELAVPVGFWRAVGSSFNGFFHESFVDELAHAAGRDPLAFRLDHLEDAPSRAVLEAVAGMSGWTGRTPPGTGRGVAFTRSFGTPVAQVVELVQEPGGLIRIARAWVACDTGRVLDPGILRQQMEGGLIYGLSAAALQQITFAGGRIEQRNFPDHDALRITGAPRIEVRMLASGEHLGGAGEPATPPAMAALANAVFDLTGERLRELPLSRRLNFVV
jgi:isoquinoline 1-oxidoreductase beta subunit